MGGSNPGPAPVQPPTYPPTFNPSRIPTVVPTAVPTTQRIKPYEAQIEYYSSSACSTLLKKVALPSTSCSQISWCTSGGTCSDVNLYVECTSSAKYNSLPCSTNSGFFWNTTAASTDTCTTAVKGSNPVYLKLQCKLPRLAQNTLKYFY